MNTQKTNNFVAKFASRLHKAKVIPDKKQDYNRKIKHKLRGE